MDNFVEAVKALTLDYTQEQMPRINVMGPLSNEIADTVDKLSKLDITSEHDQYMYAFYIQSMGKLLPLLVKHVMDLVNYDAQFLVKLQATFALNELSDIMNAHQIKLDEDYYEDQDTIMDEDEDDYEDQDATEA